MANTPPFDLFITHVESEKSCLKIFGQAERTNPVYIEKLLQQTAPQFELGHGIPAPNNLKISGLYLAKYKDGCYYRAKIIGVQPLAPGNFQVRFIDYGNVEYIHVGNLRLIDNYLSALLSLPPQAVEFFLAQISCTSESTLNLVRQELCYTEVQCCNVANSDVNRIIRIFINNVDYSQNLVNRNLGALISLQDQEAMLSSCYAPAYSPTSPALLPSTSAIPFQYKCDKLEMGSKHLVYVSYVTDGPCLFSIQPQKMEEPLSKLMFDISNHPLMPFTDAPMEGSVCLARSIEMPEVCRGVITNIVDGQFKVFFVDFGNTEILPMERLYQIPLKFVIPKVMSLRFILGGVEGIGLTHEMKVQFKNYVHDKLLLMEVVPTTGNIPIQRCNLYDGDVNLLTVIQQAALLAYQPALAPSRGSQSVRVSYILSCNKFFVQLLSKAESLQDVMVKLSEYCPNAPPVTNVRSGLPCCAQFSGDEQWYRAQVIVTDKEGVVVNFIDYGNEETVQPEYLRAITPNLVTTLRAQALECCLVGYQNMPKNEQLDELFEALTLEQDFVMRVIESRSNGVLLVELADTAGNQVAAKLIEKLAQTGSGNTTPVPQPPIYQQEQQEQQKPNARGKRELFQRSPSDAGTRESFSPSPRGSLTTSSWRCSPPTPPERGDAKLNNAHNFYQRRDPQSNSSGSPKRRSAERDFKRKSLDDSYDSHSGRPYEESNKENTRRGGERRGKVENRDRGENFGKSRNNKTSSFEKATTPSPPKPRQPKPDYAPFTAAYPEQQLVGTKEKIAVSWFYDPSNWYCQLERGNAEFRALMDDIQEAYVSRAPEKNAAPVGASVIAQFVEDRVLYRAMVLENSKVLFVDFGNVSTANRVWRIEKKFLALPKQAIRCGIAGIVPPNVEGAWPQSSAFDGVFNKESFECAFDGADEEGKYLVTLRDGDENIAETLLGMNLAVSAYAEPQAPQPPQMEVEAPVGAYLLYGQTLLVRVSHVESSEKLYVQLEPWKVDRLSAAIETLYNNGQLYRLEKPEKECVCVTKSDGDVWVRGIVKEIGAELEVVFPDWGSARKRTPENVYVLPATLNDWYQAYECGLHTSASEKTKEELERYLKADVVMSVEDVVDVKLLVSFKAATPAGNSLVCDFPVLREQMRVWVSHVASRDYERFPAVFVQSSHLGHVLEALLDNLVEFYGQKGEAIVAEVGKTCAALSADGNWYRAQITNLGDVVTVQFIDYGNREAIPKANLRVLDPQFSKPHKLALELRLDVVATEALGTELSDALTDQEFFAEVFDKNEEWYVELTAAANAEATNPVKALLERGLLLPTPEEAEEEIVKAAPAAPGGGNSVSVIVSHVDSPGQFYLQLAESSEALQKLQADLQEQVTRLPDLESPSDGILCAAPYSLDQLWYRAQVLDADNDITTVRFIDFGNTDVINNTTTAVKTLLDTELLTIEPYARRCTIEAKPIEAEEWSSAACERFEALVNSEEVRAEFVQQTERAALVRLLVNGVDDVAATLLQEGLAQQDTSTAKRESITGYVSHINSASEFWVQLESAVEDLERISYQLSNAEVEFAEVVDVSPGSLCTALFPDDESWYRARILSNTVAGIEVLFIDYGNSCTCALLRALPEDLVHLPVLAHKCSLRKPEGVQTWAPAANDKFREIANDGATVFTVGNLTAGETSTVELLLDGKDISAELAHLKAEVEKEEPARVAVNVSYFESGEKFWVTKRSDADALQKLAEALKSAPCWGSLCGARPEGLIAAMCVPENRWYRAKILDQNEDMYNVLYVDYGATDETCQVRYMRDGLEEAPPYAICCALEGEWNEGDSQKLAAVVAKATEGLEAEFLDEETTCSRIRLYLKGEAVVDVLRKATQEPAQDSAEAKSVEEAPEVVEELKEDVSPVVHSLTEATQQPAQYSAEAKSVEEAPEVVEELKEDVSPVVQSLTEATQQPAQDSEAKPLEEAPGVVEELKENVSPVVQSLTEATQQPAQDSEAKPVEEAPGVVEECAEVKDVPPVSQSTEPEQTPEDDNILADEAQVEAEVEEVAPQIAKDISLAEETPETVEESKTTEDMQVVAKDVSVPEEIEVSEERQAKADEPSVTQKASTEETVAVAPKNEAADPQTVSPIAQDAETETSEAAEELQEDVAQETNVKTEDEGISVAIEEKTDSSVEVEDVVSCASAGNEKPMDLTCKSKVSSDDSCGSERDSKDVPEEKTASSDDCTSSDAKSASVTRLV